MDTEIDGRYGKWFNPPVKESALYIKFIICFISIIWYICLGTIGCQQSEEEFFQRMAESCGFPQQVMRTIIMRTSSAETRQVVRKLFYVEIETWPTILINLMIVLNSKSRE